MSEIFKGVGFVQVYIDDIVVYSPTFAEGLTHLQVVFQRLDMAKMRASPKKCTLGKQTLSILGQIVTDGSTHCN